MKNILFIHQSAEMYGSDKVLLYLVDGIKHLGNYHLIVVLPEDGPLMIALKTRGVEVHIASVGKISRSVLSPRGVIKLLAELFKASKEINQIVGKREIAVVHSNTLAVIAGAVWSFLNAKKHLWHVHEIILSPKIVSKLYPLIVKLGADKAMCNSTLTLEWLLNYQPSLKQKSTVVFNGVPTIQQPSDHAVMQFRNSVLGTGEALIVTLAGRINHWKGQRLLLQAAVLLKKNQNTPPIKFVIVGSAAPGLEHLPDELKRFCKETSLDQDVTFIEFVDDIWPLWYGTDIAVVPSTEPEPFGMVAIEAMAAGVPVVAAAHGGLLDIVKHEQTGLLFEPGNTEALAESISRLSVDASLRKTLGAQGRLRQLDNFSIESQVKQTVSVYEQLTN